MLALASFYFLTAFLHRQESKVANNCYTGISRLRVGWRNRFAVYVYAVAGHRSNYSSVCWSMTASGIDYYILAVTGCTQKFPQCWFAWIVLGGLSLNAFCLVILLVN